MQIENFFAEVHCMKYRIRWENKNFDVIGIKESKEAVNSLDRQVDE